MAGPPQFRPTEVFGAEHDDVVDAYRRKLGHRGEAYFAEIPEAGGHPAFRMDPIADEASFGTATVP